MSASLLKRLYEGSPEDSEAATREVRALPPDQLLTVLREEARQQRRHNRKYVCVISAIMASYTYGWFWLYERAHTGGPIVALGAIAFCMLFLLVTLGFIRDAKAHRIGLEIVSESAGEIRYLGVALMILEQSPDYETSSKLRAIIGKMLVGLRADQSDQIEIGERHALRSLLNQNWDTGFTLNILAALGQIGTRDDIPAVEKLIQRVNANSQLGDAARECLLYLQRRESEQKYTQSLLRPSNQTETAPETLLRAAVAGNEATAPEHLLRPR